MISVPTDLNRCRFNNNSDTLTKYLENLNIWEYFKERGEQYGAVWGNVAPFPFGSLIAKLT